jgi:hypothetical protein
MGSTCRRAPTCRSSAPPSPLFTLLAPILEVSLQGPPPFAPPVSNSSPFLLRCPDRTSPAQLLPCLRTIRFHTTCGDPHKILDKIAILMVIFPMKLSHNPVASTRAVLPASPVDCTNMGKITPLESDANLLSPLELTPTRRALTCTNSRQITLLESSANLLSPLKLTLTENAPVSPLELTLTKCGVLKSHRITLLQKRRGGGPTIFRLAHPNSAPSCRGRGLPFPASTRPPCQPRSSPRPPSPRTTSVAHPQYWMTLDGAAKWP